VLASRVIFTGENRKHYPDGLNADLTAVRPSTLCDNILDVILQMTVQKKSKGKLGNVLPEVECAGREWRQERHDGVVGNW
jgi:hypothetical protein